MAGGLFMGVHHAGRVSRAGADAASARDRVERLQSEVARLQHKVEHLALAAQALWELLRDHTDFEEEHITAKMQEIDLRDGKTDGKIGHSPMPCPACGRMANSKRSTCIYCGGQLRRQHVFE